jgi:hypothetical protein
MSLARVQSFPISLDGFRAGEGQSLDAPFGHAGERLHEWMFATRRRREMVGEPGGSGGIDHAYSRQFAPGIGAEIMGAGKYAGFRADQSLAPLDRDGGVTTLAAALGRTGGAREELRRRTISSPRGVTHLTFTRAVE